MRKRSVLLLLFAASFVAVAGALRPAVPWPGDAGVAARMAYFAEQKDSFDVLFAGSSNIQRGIIPEVFDARMSERGHPVRSFNLAAAGMHAYMLSFLLVSLVFFRAPDLSTALAMLGDMFTAAPGPHPAVRQHLTWLWVLVVPVFAAVHAATHKIRPLERLGWIPDSGFAVAYGAAWALVLPWVATQHEPFIYFQF
jgi:hypothetical protein